MKECEITDKKNKVLNKIKQTHTSRYWSICEWNSARTINIGAKVRNYTVAEQSALHAYITTLSPQVSETNPKCTHQTNGKVYLFVDVMCFAVCFGARRVQYSQQKEDIINSSSKRCYNRSHIECSYGFISCQQTSQLTDKIYRTCHGWYE